MEILYNSDTILKEFTNKTVGYIEIIKHLKKIKSELCFRREIIKKDNSNISNNFIMKKLNKLTEDKNETYFGYTHYKKVKLYGQIKERPVSIMIVRHAKKDNAYIIELLCRHQSSERGLGKKLIELLVEKAKKNNIEKIFLESINDALQTYKKLGFTESDKCNITDSEKQEDCIGLVFNINQKGGNYKFVLNNKKTDYFNSLNYTYDYYLYLYSDDKIVAGLCFDVHLLVNMKNKIEVHYFKYDNINYLKELIFGLDSFAYTNNIYSIVVMLNYTSEDKIISDVLIDCNYKLCDVTNMYYLIKKLN